MDDLQVMLDGLEPYRFDALELRDRLDRLGSVTDDEWDQESFSIAECAHFLQGLVSESHNRVLVVRDLGGDVAILCENDSTYEVGRLCREHISESLLEDLADDENHEFAPSMARLLEAIVELLPNAGGPVRRY